MSGTGKTPGQRAYEAWHAARYPNAKPEIAPGSWSNFDDETRSWWEAGAAEAAELAAELNAARAEMERWPHCPDGCGCRLGTEDADRRDCACDGPCCEECRENGYPDAPSYRDIAVAAATAEHDRACEQLAAIRERAGNLAAKLELSAAATEPSKKSDIERQTARRIRDMATVGEGGC